MQKILEKIDQLSYPTSVFLSVCLILLLLLPLLLLVVQQQTQLRSKAVSATPEITPIQTTSTLKTIPIEMPIITRLRPWIGKSGDTIIIEGKNFGSDPSGGTLTIGNTVIETKNIGAWDDTHIEAILPPNTPQGSTVTLKIDIYPLIESAPLVFYTQETTARIHKQGTRIYTNAFNGTLTIISWIRNAQGTMTEQTTSLEVVTGTTTTLLTLPPTDTLESLIIKDSNGTILPYVADPVEFGF